MEETFKGNGLRVHQPGDRPPLPSSPAQQDYHRPAGWCLVECPHCGAAIGKRCVDKDGERSAVHDERRDLAKRNKLGNVGWHTFRHTYRSWLDDTGAPMGVQQKLMRQADIRPRRSMATR